MRGSAELATSGVAGVPGKAADRRAGQGSTPRLLGPRPGDARANGAGSAPRRRQGRRGELKVAGAGEAEGDRWPTTTRSDARCSARTRTVRKGRGRAPQAARATRRQLSLACPPGVAAPCLDIGKDPDRAYDYAAKGNMVAVISNCTAVLGLGDTGALASKPVMEGRAVLFKRFADIDLEANTEDADEFVARVRRLGKSFGGIDLEDVKGPNASSSRTGRASSS